MRCLAVLLCCSLAVLPSGAFAGPMPKLPDLPPLPTTYVGEDFSGFYAGILTGYSNSLDSGIAGALVFGNTFTADELLLGVEGIGTATTFGDFRGEISLRAGLPITDSLNFFGHAGLGYSSRTDAFVSVGSSLEADFGDGWRWRADYRFNRDLSNEQASHTALTGLLRSF